MTVQWMLMLNELWTATNQMAPYLLLGFLLAGVLSVYVSPETVERHLGRRGWRQVVKAALIGVPLPLCSCSVVPVAASLHRHGAGKGATLSFLASTPQTGVDSIAVTWSLLGPVFAVFRIGVAFVSGVLSGLGAEWLASDGGAAVPPAPRPACHGACCHGAAGRARWIRALQYGFVTLPADIGRALLLGLLVSGLLSALVPPNFFADRLGPGWVSMLIMMAVGIPIYVCSSGSVPVAYGLIHAGISPGAALVFLVTGPATNAATIATVVQLFGKRAAGVYLCCIAATALAAGWALDALPHGRAVQAAVAGCHDAAGPGGWSAAAAVLLLAVLAPALRPRR